MKKPFYPRRSYCSYLAIALLALAGNTYAHVGAGGNCASCHGSTINAITLSGNLAMPMMLSVSPRLDGGSTGSLPCFNAKPGDVINVGLNVAPPGGSGDAFAFAVTGNIGSSGLNSLAPTTVLGVKTSEANHLVFTVGSGWTTQSPGGKTYFTQGPLSWISSSSRTLVLTIGSATPPDVYSMTYRSTGVDSWNLGKWTQSQEFLINVVPAVSGASVATGAATGVTLTNATLNGTVNPAGLATSCFFQYGPTVAYGGTTAAVSVGSGTSVVPFSAAITGLNAASTYHYRLAATRSGVRSYGIDRTFATVNPVVAFSSQAAPGVAGATFSGFYGFAINAFRHVAFRGVLTGTGVTTLNNQGIWVSGTASKLVARTGSPAVGVSGGIFSALGDPVFNNRDQVAFLGTLTAGVGGVTTANATGIWCTGTTGVLGLVARAQTPVTGLPTFSLFRSVALPSSGGVMFVADLAPATGITLANNQGIWAMNSLNHLQQVVRKGQAVTVGALAKTIASFSAFTPPSNPGAQARSFNGSGALICEVTFTDGTRAILSVSPTLVVTVRAVQNSLAPQASGAVFSTFLNPAINDSNHAAFRAVIAGAGVTAANNTGIWAERGTVRGLVARTGTAAAMVTGATFAALSEPVYDNLDRVAFLGTLTAGVGGVTTANDTGLWTTGTTGVLSLIAREQAQAAGCPTGAFFASFPQFVLPDRAGVIFIGTLTVGTGGVTTANNVGVWYADNLGRPRLIARTGNTLKVSGILKTISSLTLFNPSVQSSNFNRFGGIIYRAGFTDGTQALVAIYL